MTELVPKPEQRSLQERVCKTQCVLWNICEGSTEAAPCACVWKKPEFRHDCANCPLICRERRAPEDADGSDWKNFRGHVREGRQLVQVRVSQPDDAAPLPLLIPDRTDQINRTDPLPLEWAGLNAKSLFRKGTPKSPGGASAVLTDPNGVRPRFNLLPSCKLLGVLNGKDELLERFWGSTRPDFYAELEENRFSAVTGPTFSVSQEGPDHPAAHNLVMLLRHNRVFEELADTSFTAVPNLYWRDDSYRERWTDWLNANESVSVVSRDFSRTKHWPQFRRQFDEFLDLLEEVDRPLHVILPGVGRAKAASALRYLSSVKATGSIVTSNPVNAAVCGGRRWEYRGAAPPQESLAEDIDRNEAAVHNLQVMARHLEAVTRAIGTYDPRARNGDLHGQDLEVKIEEDVGEVASEVVGHPEQEAP